MLQQLNDVKQCGVRVINFLKLIPNEVWQEFREMKKEKQLLQELEDCIFEDLDI